MNKNAIKNFAVGARRRLREQVEQKAYSLGISANGIEKADFQGNDAVVIAGRLYDATIKWQRAKLVEKIQQKGFEQVMDEAAYTWFNRFIALRFMEVSNYLEIGYRVFSNREEGKHDPEILEKALQVNLPLDREKVLYFLEENNSEELYKYLIITQCNVLNECLPFMFERISDYTELLFPDNLLNENSVVREMVKTIPEEDWREVEIIGWLYQYYISEKKDEVFAALKKNQKITKENIPAATQLFTPHWIVRYMVENSLGKLWLESHPNEELQKKWKYYLEPAEQESEVQAEIDKLINHDLRPEDITILDPACGSGHILVYAFDVLYDIYKEAGYPEKDIARLILEKNLYGLDIDDRAAQLTCFAVMMKAREKNRRILREPINLNICAIQESNSLGKEAREIILSGEQDDSHARCQVEHLLSTFYDAKEYGSIIEVWDIDEVFWHDRLIHMEQIQDSLFAVKCLEKVREMLPALVKQAQVMQKKYDVVVTNPPYMGSRGMNKKLTLKVVDHYINTKNDLGIVFIERCLKFVNINAYVSIITMHSWMFISAFENFRKNLIKSVEMKSILHLGMEAFDGIIGKVVATAALTFKHAKPTNNKVIGIRLVDYYDARRWEKESQFFNNQNKYQHTKQNDFFDIPGAPITYWISSNLRGVFVNSNSISSIASTRLGMATGSNDLFVRLWHEVNVNKIGFGLPNRQLASKSNCKWFPYDKGGDFRKWYGNFDSVVNWEKDGEAIRNFKDESGRVRSHNYNLDYIFKVSVTWSFITTRKLWGEIFSCRITF